MAVTVEHRHALLVDSLHKTWLCYGVPPDMNDVAIKVSNVPLKSKKRFLDAESLFPIQARILPPEPTLFLLTPYPQNDISSFPIRALIRFTLVYYLVSFRHTLDNVECIMLRVVHDLASTAVRASLRYYFATTTTFVARHLCLSVHSWEDLLSSDLDSVAIASSACPYAVSSWGGT